MRLRTVSWRVLQALLLALLVLVLVLAINTWRQPSRQLAVPARAPVAVDVREVAGKLSEAV
ncbi:MAG: hypothetical protein IIZ92_02845, partial [Aquincola sp.]|nr:hypothetical protein [Aquincola sp.]